MNSWQSILQRMGNNFIVAAFVPSMGFVIFSLIAFEPILPPTFVDQLGGEQFTEWGKTTFIVFILTTILGFTLFALSTYIYKSFEGYTFLFGLETALRNSGITRQKSRARKILNKRKRIDRTIEKLERKVTIPTWGKTKETGESKNTWMSRRQIHLTKRLDALKDRQYDLLWQYNQNFPPKLHLILPTRFGNILRAAEMYPAIHYGMDAVPLYGRLAHVIPEDGMEKLDQSNNQCLFLLNCALLSTIFSIISIIASGYQYLISIWSNLGNKELLYFIPIDLPIYIYQQRIWIYIVLAILGAVIAWFFYKSSLLNVSQYGSMIRSVFDLYRFKLIEALHLELPNDSNSEYQMWKKISEFMAAGQELGEITFDFVHPSDRNQQK